MFRDKLHGQFVCTAPKARTEDYSPYDSRKRHDTYFPRITRVFFFAFIMCQVICCEISRGYNFTVSPNVVIVIGIMLNLENARALSIYYLLYNLRNTSF